MSQLRLSNLDRPQTPKAEPTRALPLLWVRKLLVLRDLALGEQHVVREVNLRRGLNIIWTPPSSEDTENALFQDGMVGHTAGKTTFCRLLRHALGERTFGSEPARRRIRDKFPNGWVLAEVVIEGTSWAVARPFAIGAHPFCVRDGSIESAIDGGTRLAYEEFLDAVSTATVSALPARRFPSTDEMVRWEHLLPWLARDQECRFADFMEWRSTTSDSEAPGLTAEDRQFLMRSVLGLISDGERAEQLNNARLVSQRRQASRRVPLLEHVSLDGRRRVEAYLDQRLEYLSTGLFASHVRNQLEQRRLDVEVQLAQLTATNPLGEAHAALMQAVRNQENARRNVQDASERLQLERGALAVLEGSGAEAALLAELPPALGFCNQPMNRAMEHGCPLATSLPISLSTRRSERTAGDEIERLRELVSSLETVLADHQAMLSAREEETRVAERNELAARTQYDQQRSQLVEDRARLLHVQRLVTEAADAETAARQEAEHVERLAADIERSYTRQEQLRSEHSRALAAFGASFDYTVRALLGDGVAGRAELVGRAVGLSIEHRGDRDSAAIATVKLLSFDLAALTESIQGRGHFPRFLLHDGPREADLAPEIYERLFFYLRQLERCFDDNEPSFQYIVTTTTQPPKGLLSQPWLRLRLSGTPAEERLLRCDL